MDIWIIFFTEMLTLLSRPQRFTCIFVQIAEFVLLLGYFRIFVKTFSETLRGKKLILCIHVKDISMYINCILFQWDKNSGCYGNLQFPLTYNGNSGNWQYLLCIWDILNFILHKKCSLSFI